MYNYLLLFVFKKIGTVVDIFINGPTSNITCIFNLEGCIIFIMFS